MKSDGAESHASPDGRGQQRQDKEQEQRRPLPGSGWSGSAGRRLPMKIAGAFALFGALWIYFSDRLLLMLVTDPEQLTTCQNVKGWAFVSASAVLIYILAHMHTRDAEKAEAALRKSEQRFRGLVELSPEAILVNRDDRIVYVNPAALALFGATDPEQILGKSVISVFHPDFHPVIRERIHRMLEQGGPVPMIREMIMRLDGATVDVEVAAASFTDAEGPAILVLLRDVTECKRVEDEIRKLNLALEKRVAERTAQIEAANRHLESFCYSVSHDLRAPLRAISGFAQILARRHQERLNDEGRHYMDNIVLAAERMSRLIDDLLAYSRLERRTVSRQPVSLRDIVAEVVGDHAARIAETGASINVADDLPILDADPTLLHQILGNLIGNGLAYIRRDVIPRVSVDCLKESDRVVLSVADNGLGIAPEYHGKIFNVFQRLHSDDAYPGTGIGLAIVKKSVEMLRGKVWLESRVGEGTTFFVQLPVE
jgi:hypothetical protein